MRRTQDDGVIHGNRHVLVHRRWGSRFYKQVWSGIGAAPDHKRWKDRNYRIVQCDVEAGDAATLLSDLAMDSAQKRQPHKVKFVGGLFQTNATVPSLVFEDVRRHGEAREPSNLISGTGAMVQGVTREIQGGPRSNYGMG
jgi:hypothetical protein